MADLADLVIGDDYNTTVTLRGGAFSVVQDISGATSVKIAIIAKDYTAKYVTEVSSLSGDSGADWTNGVIAVDFTGVQTADLDDYFTTKGFARLEIQVTEGGRTSTWSGPGSIIPIVPGLIA